MLIDEIATYLEEEGIGTVGEDIFCTLQPDEPIKCATIFDTGGLAPDKYIPVEDPTIQIITRDETYEGAKQKAVDIYDKLHRKANFTLTTIYVYFIDALQSPADIGRDPKDNFEISCNYHLKVRE